MAALVFTQAEASAIRSGHKTQHRVPISPAPAHAPADILGGIPEGEFIWPPAGPAQMPMADLAAYCPFGPAGATVTASVRLLYGKNEPLQVRITSVRVERLEAISDADLTAEGAANWTQYAFGWGEQHARAGFPVDVNPLVWVFEFYALA